MPSDIEYEQLKKGNGFCAKYHGKKIGEIDIVTIGANRIIIESTTIDDSFRDTELCRNLVQCVAEFARKTHKKVLSLCPRAQSIFNRYPEFDDIRLISIAE